MGSCTIVKIILCHKIKESELKTNRHNRPIQKSELDINRLYRPIQSEDRIGIGRSINRTFRPPLPISDLNLCPVLVLSKISYLSWHSLNLIVTEGYTWSWSMSILDSDPPVYTWYRTKSILALTYVYSWSLPIPLLKSKRNRKKSTITVMLDYFSRQK